MMDQNFNLTSAVICRMGDGYKGHVCRVSLKLVFIY